jgi:calcium/calmodulin-dependent protein kinase I
MGRYSLSLTLQRIDMWACGIIMFMLIQDRHPLYQPSDNEKSFLLKLRNPHWSFSPKFSSLAKDFFLKLCNPSSLERYTSEQALRHPWITRDFSSPIPLT